MHRLLHFKTQENYIYSSTTHGVTLATPGVYCIPWYINNSKCQKLNARKYYVQAERIPMYTGTTIDYSDTRTMVVNCTRYQVGTASACEQTPRPKHIKRQCKPTVDGLACEYLTTQEPSRVMADHPPYVLLNGYTWRQSLRELV